MQQDELFHHGTKGQKHGVNRYQTADGKWTPLGLKRRREREGFGGSDSEKSTPKKLSKRENYFARKKRLKAEAEEAEKKRKAELEAETYEQRRERILKSTDPKELYKNRDVLTTAEINERINRIDTEQRLAKLSESTVKKGKSKTQKALDILDAGLKMGRKASEVYDFMQKPMMKALSKKLGFTPPEPVRIVDYERFLANINRMSNDQVRQMSQRVTSERLIRNYVDERRQST